MSLIPDFRKFSDESLAFMATDAEGREILERSYRGILYHLGEMPRAERKAAEKFALRIQKALRSGRVEA